MTHTKQEKAMKVDTMKEWMDYARKFDLKFATQDTIELWSDERAAGVTITVLPFGRIAVSAPGRFGGVKMNHHGLMGAGARIEGCGHLIEHGGPSAFSSFGGAPATTWSREHCMKDLEALLLSWIDSAVDLMRDEDFDGARHAVSEVQELRKFIGSCECRTFIGAHAQGLFVAHVDDCLDVDDLGMTGIYRCGETLTDDCWWTLAMLWRASELLVARCPGKLPPEFEEPS